MGEVHEVDEEVLRQEGVDGLELEDTLAYAILDVLELLRAFGFLQDLLLLLLSL